MRLVKVKFKPDTKEGREICDAIDRAEGNVLLENALRIHLQTAMRAGLREFTK
ncbi:hypothetical protein [Pseudomonas sp. Hg5Tf]|uniref:Uncharacterized protein n=1 Tax=Pseudomonas sp. Hg7Tf TaxID=3236988 RepID=A0AB39HWD4_9PSED|nr:hypothetical protein [Pseudomonas sp. Hg5Tf]MDH2559027.1 hypothetical protein [Pseudomonas sp. Hg5Tf]